MSSFQYDLHVHSCLSPCGEDDMTPYSIAGMAKLNGLELVALTDHNACGNCGTFFKACQAYGVVPVPGMELTTGEDIHLLCLFPTLPDALAFEKDVRARRVRVPNRPEIFGNQLLIGPEDEPVGTEPDLLINATELSLTEGKALAERHNGAAYPAHIDREANGIIAILGEVPAEPDFACVEFHDPANMVPYEAKYGLAGKRMLASSDAHRLWDLGDGSQSIALDCGKEDPEQVRRALIRKLRGRRA